MVAVLMSPEREGNGREVVDDGRGVSVLGQVDGAHVELAGVASFDANMRKLFRLHIDRQFLLVLFALLLANYWIADEIYPDFR